MDASPFLAPQWGTMEQWNRAFEKVEDYLRAHRIDSRLQRARLTQMVLASVAAMPAPADPGRPGTVETLAIEECRRLMSEWYRMLFSGAGRDDSADSVDARIALLVSDTAVRWPYAFMRKQQVPDDMQRALQASPLRAGPALSVSHMVPRAIDMGIIPEIASGTMATFVRWPILRLVTIWTVYLLILAALFYVTRR
jgi:hypothetical protein